MSRTRLVFLQTRLTDDDLGLRGRSKEERLALFHTRRLMRAAFYADLNRKPPTQVNHMPSYVRAVRERWNLKYNNSARQLLAEIEGFSNWEELMSAA